MASRAIEDINWLAHRWPIALETSGYGNWTLHTARIDGQRVGQASSREDFDRRFAAMRPQCLARLIASRPALQPAVALVVAGEVRLGRIPPQLWCGYDGVELLDLPALTLLSAKVRALFPDWPQALIRVVRRDQLRALGLTPAPRAPQLRALA